MNIQQEQEFDIVIRDLLLALREKITLIVAVTVLSMMFGWGTSVFLIPKRYEASVNMIVNMRTDATAAMTSDDIYGSQSLVNTYAVIIKSNTVLNRLIAELELNISYEELYEEIIVEAVNHTQVMRIAIQHEDPGTAENIIDTLANIAPQIVADAVEAGSSKVVSDVYVTKDPVYPDTVKNGLWAAALGLIFAVAAIVLKEIQSDYIVDDKDVSRKLGIPVLGMIPDMGVK